MSATAIPAVVTAYAISADVQKLTSLSETSTSASVSASAPDSNSSDSNRAPLREPTLLESLSAFIQDEVFSLSRTEVFDFALSEISTLPASNGRMPASETSPSHASNSFLQKVISANKNFAPSPALNRNSSSNFTSAPPDGSTNRRSNSSNVNSSSSWSSVRYFENKRNFLVFESYSEPSEPVVPDVSASEPVGAGGFFNSQSPQSGSGNGSSSGSGNIGGTDAGTPGSPTSPTPTPSPTPEPTPEPTPTPSPTPTPTPPPPSFDATMGRCYNNAVEVTADPLSMISASIPSPVGTWLTTDGHLFVAENGPSSWIVHKFLPNGSYDTSFGTAGIGGLSAAGLGALSALSLDSTGKIVLVGTSSGPASSRNFLSARLESNGMVDLTYGTAGRTSVDFFGAQDQGFFVKPLSTGNLLFLGLVKPAGSFELGAALLDSTGLLTAGFLTSGRGQPGNIQVNNQVERKIHTLELSPTELLIAASTNSGDLRFVKTDHLGNLQPAFGVGGVAVSSWNVSNSEALVLEQTSASTVAVLKHPASGSGGILLGTLDLSTGAQVSDGSSTTANAFCQVNAFRRR